MARLVQIGIVLVVLAAIVAVVDFVMNPSGSPVRTTLRTVRDAAVEQYERLSGRTTEEPAEEAAPAPAPARPPARAATSAAVPSSVPLPAPGEPAPTRTPVIEMTPVAPAANGPGEAAPSSIPRRGDFYLPGRLATWTSYNVNVAGPMIIRAGGRVVAGNDATGPNGLSASNFERALEARRPAPTANQRVLPTAPYLALLGRVCSGELCSEPFVVGSNKVICPADLNVTGSLQLWTNNYIRLDGTQTALNFSSVFGGYSFYVEPAPESLCASGARLASSSSSADAAALSAGQVLRKPEYTISSSQSSWKPFFVPLSEPLLIRATGSMRPRGGADATGPGGIAVPAGAPWSYPGARDLVIDDAHHLFDASLPYQALIGRLCGPERCGAPFLVGSERVICPTPALSDRLELWVNHIIRPTGLLGTQTPLTLDAFELQTRQGEYRFEVSRAPLGACGS